ncbi:MAG: SIS domain-containing protein [Crocinitomix sp.]|nr:SIS domain-containing protein [Crocinitomix sp.]
MNSQTNVIINEVSHLVNDFNSLRPVLEKQISEQIKDINSNALSKIYVVGSGDSYFAGLVVKSVFDLIPDLTCEVINTFTLINYIEIPIQQEEKSKILVIAVSSSGNSPRMIQGLEKLRENKVKSLILTANPEAKALGIANYCLKVQLLDKSKSPGIRTFQVSLLGLILLASKLGLERNAENRKLKIIYNSLPNVSKFIDSNFDKIKSFSFALASEIVPFSTLIYLGSGPNYGIAKYSAAKLIETTATLTIGQDVEEWWHVERFLKPFDMPILMFVPDGPSLKRALEIREAALELGRSVYLLTMASDSSDENNDLDEMSFLNLKGELPEELTVFVYYIFSCFISDYTARAKGSTFFEKSHE